MSFRMGFTAFLISFIIFRDILSPDGNKIQTINTSKTNAPCFSNPNCLFFQINLNYACQYSTKNLHQAIPKSYKKEKLARRNELTRWRIGFCSIPPTF